MTAPKRIKGPRIKHTVRVPKEMAERMKQQRSFAIEETYDEAMSRILHECEESGLNFDHEFGKYLAGI